jgi:3D (Asp-Asp-Asp) domain-containing protein
MTDSNDSDNTAKPDQNSESCEMEMTNRKFLTSNRVNVKKNGNNTFAIDEKIIQLNTLLSQ